MDKSKVVKRLKVAADEKRTAVVDATAIKIEPDEINTTTENVKIIETFNVGDFVVLKTDMIDYMYPTIWKIDGHNLIQKYIPFCLTDEILYTNTSVYSYWGADVIDKYYWARATLIRRKGNDDILQCFIDEVKEKHKVELEKMENEAKINIKQEPNESD